MKKISTIILLFAVTLSIFTVFSCADPASAPYEPVGGGATSPASAADTPASSEEAEEGYFIDAPAYGLYYRAYPSGLCGTTNRSGMFRYRRGDSVTFYVGSLAIGNSVHASRCISPLSIARATTIYGNSPESVLARNIIRFLMAMSTGISPYGLCIPSSLGSWNGNLLSILSSPNFEPLVVDVVAALRGIVPSEVVLPSIESAQEHFVISESLIDQIEQSSAKNLYASMKLPAIFRNSYVDVFYNRSGFAQNETSYQSGFKVLVGNNRNASFSAQLQEGDWQLTLAAMQQNTGFTVNDVLAFYTPNGFSSTPVSGYSLRLTSEKEMLHADLTDTRRSCVISEVHRFSGEVSVPLALPDNTQLTDAVGGSLRLFIDILGTDGNRTGSVMIMLQLPDAENMECSENTVTIPFSTTLPDGYRYKAQIYYKPDTSKRYYVRQARVLDENFTTDITNVNFNFTSWENQ